MEDKHSKKFEIIETDKTKEGGYIYRATVEQMVLSHDSRVAPLKMRLQELGDLLLKTQLPAGKQRELALELLYIKAELDAVGEELAHYGRDLGGRLYRRRD